MIRNVIRFFAFLALCALLVYTPEILQTVSAPYRTETPRRILLRIALHSVDEASVAAINKRLTGFQKEHTSVHLRVTSVQDLQLLSLHGPLPDVLILPASASPHLSFPIIYSEQAFAVEGAQRLIVCVSGDTAEMAAASSLAAYLTENAPAPAPPADF